MFLAENQIIEDPKKGRSRICFQSTPSSQEICWTPCPSLAWHTHTCESCSVCELNTNARLSTQDKTKLFNISVRNSIPELICSYSYIMRCADLHVMAMPIGIPPTSPGKLFWATELVVGSYRFQLMITCRSELAWQGSALLKWAYRRIYTWPVSIQDDTLVVT